MHVLMRDEKEGRKKQARSNKQQGKATQHTQGSYFMYNICIILYLLDTVIRLNQEFMYVHISICI